MKRVYPNEIRQGYSEDDMCVMLLYEPQDNLYVPIIIGRHEAEAIVIALEEQPTQRPLTHELFSSLLFAFGLTLNEVTIDRLEEGVFHATLHVTDGVTRKRIDARASDAIVIAIREMAPISMADAVVKEAGFAANEEDEATEKEPTLEELEAQLRRCEESEDYERAAEIMEKIKQINNEL